MPNNEDIQRFYPPARLEPVAEPDEESIEEGEELVEQEEQEQPEGDKKTVWVGSPDAPRKADDGISDLFEGPNLEEEDEDMADLTEVDFEKDILDAGDDGTLDDLTSVSQEDIIGRSPKRKVVRRPVRRTARRYNPPAQMGGLQF